MAVRRPNAPTRARKPDDAELRRLGRELDEISSLQSRASDDTDAIARLCDLGGKVVRRIANTPALTLEGLKVKARAAMWCHEGDMTDLVRAESTDLRLIAGVVTGILAVA